MNKQYLVVFIGVTMSDDVFYKSFISDTNDKVKLNNLLDRCHREVYEDAHWTIQGIEVLDDVERVYLIKD